MQTLGDAGFDLGYLHYGEGHDHWLKARDKFRETKAYEKWSRILNKLAIQNPLYVLAGIVAIEYATAIAQCSGESKAIVEKRKSVNA